MLGTGFTVNWSEVLIALASIGLLFWELKAIRQKQMLQQKSASWPEFEEAVISALQSGLSISESFSMLSQFQPQAITTEFKELVFDLERGQTLETALRAFQAKVKLGFADLFVSIVLVTHHSGSDSLVMALTEHVQAVRKELAAAGDAQARQNAILGVAKLGLLAPWVLLGVLSINENTRNSFSELPGQGVLIAGFAVSFLAYRIIVSVGSAGSFKRVLGGENA